MDIKSLMVGNWVQGNPCGQHCDRNNKTYYKIAVLDIGNHCWGYSVCGAIVELKYDNIFPIPLTPEILEKNGFVYFHKNYASLSYDNPFKLKMTNWPDENGLDGLWTICDIIEIRFVHQLQHALRLCGINKEIEL